MLQSLKIWTCFVLMTSSYAFDSILTNWKLGQGWVQVCVTNSSVFPATGTNSQVVGYWICGPDLPGTGRMFKMKQAAAQSPTLLGGLVWEDVDPSTQLGAASYDYQSSPACYWNAVVLTKQPNGDCKIEGYLRDDVPVTSAADNTSYSNLIYSLDDWDASSYFNNSNNFFISESSWTSSRYVRYQVTGMVVITFNGPVVATDWNDPAFIKMLKFGPFSQDYLRTTFQSFFNGSTVGTYPRTVLVNGSNLTSQLMVTERVSSADRMGIRMYDGSVYTISSSYMMSETFTGIYVIHNYDPILSNSNTLSINQTVQIGSRGTVLADGNASIEVNVDIYSPSNSPSSGELTIDVSMNCKVLGTSIGGPAGTTTNLTNASIAQGVHVAITVAILYQNFSPTSATVAGVAMANVLVLASPAYINTPSDVWIERGSVKHKLPFNVSSTDSPFSYNTFTFTATARTAFPNPDPELRFWGLIESIGETDLEATFPTFVPNASYTGLCIFDRPSTIYEPGLNLSYCSMMPTAIKGNVLNYCNTSFATTSRGYCEYCVDQYYPDLTDYYLVNFPNNCRNKSSCLAAPGMLYYNPWEGTANDAQGVCITCPYNCLTCDIQGNCLSCFSPHSTLDVASSSCTCNVSNCMICVNSACDLCQYPYMLQIDANRNNWCFLPVGYQDCSSNFGLDHNFYYNAFNTHKYRGCRKCQNPLCVSCDNSYTSACSTTCPSGLYYIDMSKAVDEAYALTYQCTVSTTIVPGYVFSVTLDNFVRCMSNCRICSASNSSSCQLCSANFMLYPNSSCLAGSSCMVGYFNDTLSSCQACDSACATCSSSPACLTCGAGMFMFPNQSCTTCLQEIGYFINGTKCSEIPVPPTNVSVPPASAPLLPTNESVTFFGGQESSSTRSANLKFRLYGVWNTNTSVDQPIIAWLIRNLRLNITFMRKSTSQIETVGSRLDYLAPSQNIVDVLVYLLTIPQLDDYQVILSIDSPKTFYYNSSWKITVNPVQVTGDISLGSPSDFQLSKSQGTYVSGLASLNLVPEQPSFQFAFLGVLSTDPSGMTIRSSQTLRLINRLGYLNIYFGAQATSFLDTLEANSGVEKESADAAMERISKNFRNKLTSKRVFVEFGSKQQWTFSVYLTSFVIGFIVRLLVSYRPRLPMGAMTVLYWIPKIHWYLFTTFYLDLVFYATHAVLHARSSSSIALGYAVLVAVSIDMFAMQEAVFNHNAWILLLKHMNAQNSPSTSPIFEDSKQPKITILQFKAAQSTTALIPTVGSTKSNRIPSSPRPVPRSFENALYKSRTQESSSQASQRRQKYRLIDMNIPMIEMLATPYGFNSSAFSYAYLHFNGLLHFWRLAIYQVLILSCQNTTGLALALIVLLEIVVFILTLIQHLVFKNFVSPFQLITFVSPQPFFISFGIIALLLINSVPGQNVASQLQNAVVFTVLGSVFVEYSLVTYYILSTVISYIVTYVKSRRSQREKIEVPSQAPNKITPLNRMPHSTQNLNSSSREVRRNFGETKMILKKTPIHAISSLSNLRM